jgi:hypothetical protein
MAMCSNEFFEVVSFPLVMRSEKECYIFRIMKNLAYCLLTSYVFQFEVVFNQSYHSSKDNNDTSNAQIKVLMNFTHFRDEFF